MITDRDVIRVVETWLDEEVTVIPDRILDAVLDKVPATRQRRAGWLARRFPIVNSNAFRFGIAAVAVVLIAIVGYQFVFAPTVGGPGPSSSPSVTATPTPAPSLTATDYADHPYGSRLAAGSYVFSHLAPLRVTFTVPTGWEKGALDWVVWSVENSKATLAVVGVDNTYADPCHPERGLSDDPAVGPWVDDLATALGNLPGLTFSEPTDVSVSGFAGKYMEYVPPSTFGDCAEEILLWSVNGRTSAQPAPTGNQSFKVWILDVRGARLVIATSSLPGVPRGRVTELESIVDSIRIE